MVLREGGKGKREESEEIAGEREHRQTRPREAQKDSSNYVAISSALSPSLPPSLPPVVLPDDEHAIEEVDGHAVRREDVIGA